MMLGSALADFAAFSDPQAYVLFGGIAQAGQVFADRVQYHLEQNSLQIFKGKITVKTSTLHQQNAAVLGTAAAMFWHINKKSA
jgi:glucokinase